MVYNYLIVIMEAEVLDEAENVVSRDEAFILASFRCTGVLGHLHSLV